MKSVDVNRIKIIIILFLYFLFVNHKSISQDLVINEIMSLNNSTIMDKFGDYPDWIELYNKSNFTINLHNYSLSDDAEELDKWKFPEISIPSNSYLLIFASGKNILDTTELHANFKIASSGENLFLANNSGITIDQIDSVSLMEDITYGCLPDGSDVHIKLAIPTPGSSNNLNNQLVLSHKGGFYSSPFYLEISAITSDTIFYTLDGSIPTKYSSIFKDSLFFDFKYSSPNILAEIPTTPDQSLISHKAWELPAKNIHKANIFRCASFRDNLRTSGIYTHTFLIDSMIFDKYDLPVISLVTEMDNLFDHGSGIFVPGKHFSMDNPEESGNYFQSGDVWEKPVHIEYYENNGHIGFAQDCGVRIHGSRTRHAAQKSLRLYARQKYGENYFNYPLLPQKLQNDYKRILLRTSMATSWKGNTMINDVLAHELVRNLNVDFQDYQPVVVYINGEYWGIHNIRDRIDKRYIAYTHKLHEDSIIFSYDDDAQFDDLLDFIEFNSLEDDSNYDYLLTQIDIDNFIDYQIAEMFFSNYDWPGNNVTLWKTKNPDSKWRWIFYDIDDGFGDHSYNMFVHATMNDDQIVWPNPPASTFIFRNLLKNQGFVNQFIKRYAEILNQDFNYHTMENKLLAIKKLYQHEIPHHISRWNYPESENQWQQEIEDVLLKFLKKRPCYVEYNLVSFFNLKEFGFTCELSDVEQSVKIAIVPNPSDGIFFIYNNSKSVVKGNLSISDIAGKIVYTKNDVALEANEKRYFNLMELPSNTYILNFYSNDFSERKKIVIIN